MTQNEWEALLDASPGDMDLRLGYALWLQDEADDPLLSAYQRWVICSGYYPYKGYSYIFHDVSWDWWKDGTFNHLNIFTGAGCNLPDHLFRHFHNPDGDVCLEFRTRRAAEDALLRHLVAHARMMQYVVGEEYAAHGAFREFLTQEKSE